MLMACIVLDYVLYLHRFVIIYLPLLYYSHLSILSQSGCQILAWCHEEHILTVVLIPADPTLSPCLSISQADERYRKNLQGTPHAAPPKQPPLPQGSELYTNENSSTESSGMHRPMEPQVTWENSLLFFLFLLPYLSLSLFNICKKVIHIVLI